MIKTKSINFVLLSVELKWTKIPRDTEIGLNQEMILDCDALGSPEPKIEWRRLTTNNESKHTSSNGMLFNYV